MSAAPNPAPLPLARWRHDLAQLAGAAVLAQALPLAVLPWLTRVFDASDIGRWTLFAALASNLAVVACWRLEYAIVLPRRTVVARWVLALCLVLAVGWAVALGLSLVLAAWLLGGPPAAVGLGAAADATGPAGGLVRPNGLRETWHALGTTLAWLPLAVGLAGVVQALTLWHNRAGHWAPISHARVVAPGVAAGLQAVAGALRWPGAQALVGAQVLGQVVAAAWLAWSARGVLAGLWRPAGPARRRVGRRRWLRVARRLVRRYRQFPLVNAPHAFVNALQDTLALALVLALAGPVAAGLFGLMVRVVMAPTSLIGGALSEMLLGRAAATWREGGDVLPMLRRAVWLLGACALPSAMVLAWAGPWLFATVLGPAWREAGEWARWLAPYMAGRMIVGPLTVLPMIFQRQATAFAFSLCGNALYVLGLGLGLLAVPAWGVSDALRWACGLVSLLMGAYFAVYLAWLWRLAAARRAASVGAA